MITGWSKLQLPLGAESHGRGAFTPPPPSMANRPALKEQRFYPCKIHGDRGGLDNICFPDLIKATLVENLIGALMNATEILDGFEDPSGVPATVKQFLGFEASSREQDLALASHSLPQSEPLELLFHERLSHGSSAQTSISPLFGNVVSMPYCPQRNGGAHHAVQSSSALHVGGLSDGRQRKLSVNAIHAADHGRGNSHSSEEDLLLQEARSKAFTSRMEHNEVKGSSRARMSHDGLAHAVPPDFKQGQAKEVTYGMARKDEVHAETGNGWPYAANTRPSQQISLLWGSIALVILLTGTLLVTCRTIFFKGRQLQRSSVKRRILKSHWYGNPGSNAWEHRNFQMKISEFPQYPLLEVDGDKKLLRVPSESAGITAAFARRGSQPLIRAQNPQKQPIRQSIHGMGRGHVSPMNKGQVQQPIRQTLKSSKTLCRKTDGFMKARSDNVSNGGAFAVPLPATSNGSHKALEEKGKNVVPQQTSNGFYGRRVRSPSQDTVSEQRVSRMNASKSRSDQGQWGDDDELDLDRRIQKLYQTIQSVEQHRREAMIALEEERQRSLALEQEMSKQREVAALLGEEVRILKESHNALLTSLRKKYSTSAAARTAADLVYQDWERRVAAE